MSGHLRFCIAAFLFAGLSASPASSNPFDALFNSAPAEATAPAPAPAPAEVECLAHPGKTTADGQHWVYRYDGHRKCWFEAAEGIATMKKPAHHQAAKQRVATPEDDEATPRKRKAVVDARMELLRPAPSEKPQPTPPAPDLRAVDAAPVSVGGAAALVPPAPVVPNPATDQLAPDQPVPPQVDVGAFPAAAPATTEAVAASAPPATPVTVPIAEAGDGGQGWTGTWLGVLLMAMGLVSLLLCSSRPFRGAVLVGRFFDPRTKLAAIADGGSVVRLRPEYVQSANSRAGVVVDGPRAPPNIGGVPDPADGTPGEWVRDQIERPREVVQCSQVFARAPLRPPLLASR